MTNHDSVEQRAFYYSPLSFLREREKELSSLFLESLEKSIQEGELECIGGNVKIWVRYLDWDSQYFRCPTYRLEFADWIAGTPNPSASLAKQLIEYKAELSIKHSKFYLFTAIPSEDTVVLQALGLAGLRLIETRLTHYVALKGIDMQSISAVREGALDDIPNLRDVAMQARNDYDRFHADPFFSKKVADIYLAEYVEQCVRGLTDIVLVPDCDEMLPNAFICGSFDISALDKIRIGRLVLVAVANVRRGWYRDLNKALLMKMKTRGMEYCVNTTQSTNKAVVHVCEQLGYKYGQTSHIFSTHN